MLPTRFNVDYKLTNWIMRSPAPWWARQCCAYVSSIYDNLHSTYQYTSISLVKMVEGVDIFRHPNLCSDQMTNYIIRQQLQQDFISQSNATPTIPS